jgi:hypothetical protein
MDRILTTDVRSQIDVIPQEVHNNQQQVAQTQTINPKSDFLLP